MSLYLINTFLTLPLDGRASDFMFGYFNPREKVLPGTHWTRFWVAPRVGLDVLNKKTF
jgi:amino acid permease